MNTHALESSSRKGINLQQNQAETAARHLVRRVALAHADETVQQVLGRLPGQTSDVLEDGDDFGPDGLGGAEATGNRLSRGRLGLDAGILKLAAPFSVA